MPIAELATCWTAEPHVIFSIPCMICHTVFCLCGASKFPCAVCVSWSGTNNAHRWWCSCKCILCHTSMFSTSGASKNFHVLCVGRVLASLRSTRYILLLLPHLFAVDFFFHAWVHPINFWQESVDDDKGRREGSRN